MRLLYLIFLFLFSQLAQAQKAQLDPKIKFEITGRCFVENRETADLRIILTRGKDTLSLFENIEGFEFNLEFNSEYLINFMKKGYCTKQVKIVTKDISLERWNKKIKPYFFKVKLFPKEESVHCPILMKGAIVYSEIKDEFDYDANY